MWKLSACLLAAPKLVLIVAVAVAVIVGGDLWDDRLKAEFWDGIVLYTGTIAGLGFLWCFGPRPAFYWGPLVIASSVLRISISLILAVALATVVHPEKLFFWGVFLTGSFLILGAETAVVKGSLAAPLSLKRPEDRSSTESKAA